MSSPSQLLGRSDQLARDLLLLPDRSAGLGPFLGWQDMINQTAEAWRAASAVSESAPTPDPFLVLQAIINNDKQSAPRRAPSTDGRVAELVTQLGRLTGHYRFTRTSSPASPAARTERAQGSILHAGYLITHAAGLALRREAPATNDPDLRSDIGRARQTIGIAELILDVHLHRSPHTSEPVRQLDLALAQWAAIALQVLTEQPPEPKNNYIISDVQHGLIAHTAALLTAGTKSRPSRVAPDDVRQRLLPALRQSADTWRQTRDAWAQLSTPTTGISRDLADAARGLQQAIRGIEPVPGSNPGHALAGGLAVGVETAHQMVRAFASEQLRAPTDVVVALTKGVLDRQPLTDPYQIWKGMDRHTGRAPISLPDVLRQDLVQSATRNVEAGRHLRSAAHALLDTRTHTPPSVHRPRSPGVHAADQAPAARPRAAASPHR